MKKIIATPLAPKAVGPYSQAVELNGTLYVSGQLPADPETGALAEGICHRQHRQLRSTGQQRHGCGKDDCYLFHMELVFPVN